MRMVHLSMAIKNLFDFHYENHFKFGSITIYVKEALKMSPHNQ